MSPQTLLLSSDEPHRWLASSPILDTADCRLRLRALAITQLCKSDREKVLALYAFVKRMPFARTLKFRLRTARQVLDAGKGDADDKASLLVALLRSSGFPSRIRYVELHGEILHGMSIGMTSVARPVVEVHVGNGWIATDTYIFDSRYIGAAHRRLAKQQREWGYGVSVNGRTLWDGKGDSYLTGAREMAKQVSLGDLGLYHDPLEFVRRRSGLSRLPRVAKAIRWGLVSSTLDRAAFYLRPRATV